MPRAPNSRNGNGITASVALWRSATERGHIGALPNLVREIPSTIKKLDPLGQRADHCAGMLDPTSRTVH
jgi:hypothetical protein